MRRAASITAVILDVDGTVVTCPYDFDAMRAAVVEVACRWGWEPGGSHASPLPRGVIERIETVAADLGERGAGFRAEVERAVGEIEIAAAQGAELLPGAAEALGRLRQSRVKIGLITRNCRAACEAALRGLACCDVLLTRDDVPLPKPDPDHVLRALRALRCAPDRAAVVGDHSFDMQAGRAAGVRLCVGVRTGGSDPDTLRAAGADVVIDSIADLAEALLAWEGSEP